MGNLTKKFMKKGLLVFSAFLIVLPSLVNSALALDWEAKRMQMIAVDLVPRGIRSPAVLKAMKQVPRQEFVPKHIRKLAYADRPLPIGEGQTISQPYVVAWMSQLLEIEKGMKVLEIGTGSGY